MTKHTPGPWFVDGAKPHQVVLHTEKTNLLRIASVNTQFTGTYAANARLIAAAPDLLEALQLIQGQGWQLHDDEFGNEIKRRCLSAIAKATATAA